MKDYHLSRQFGMFTQNRSSTKTFANFGDTFGDTHGNQVFFLFVKGCKKLNVFVFKC